MTSRVTKPILSGMVRALKRENAQLTDDLAKERSKNAALEFAYDRAFFEWCADRMVYVYGADPQADFVQKLRRMAGSRP